MGKLRTCLAAYITGEKTPRFGTRPQKCGCGLAARVRSEGPAVMAATLVLGPPGEQCGGLARSTEQRQ
jgi:hypothetical protein